MKTPVVLALSLSILNVESAWSNWFTKHVAPVVHAVVAPVQISVQPVKVAEQTLVQPVKVAEQISVQSVKVAGQTLVKANQVIDETLKGASDITRPLLVPVKDVANLVVAPALLKIGVDPRVLNPVYDPIASARRFAGGAGQAGVHALGSVETMSRGIGTGDRGMFWTGVSQAAGAAVETALNPQVIETVDYALPIPWFSFESGMEKPEISVITPDHQTSSEMILFINGMATTREEALAEASALAEHLGRPVGLLYNLHTTKLSDAAQALRDRTDMFWTLFAPSGDRTVRQLIYFLANTPGNISLVSHSQGSLIVNAALRQAIRRNPSIEARIRWVGLGSPFVQAEVPYALNKKTFIHHSGDPVTEVLGGNALEDQSQQWKSGHAFQTYLPQVELADLW